MKQVILIVLTLFVGCTPSKQEQAIADYEQVINLDIISLAKTSTLAAKDSIPILNKMIDSLAYKKMQGLFKSMERDINLIGAQSYRVIMARTEAQKKEAQSMLDLYESMLEEQKKRLSLYQRKIYDSTDLRAINQRLRLYQSKPDSLLADKYDCVYADGNKKISKTYYIRDDKVVYAGIK